MAKTTTFPLPSSFSTMRVEAEGLWENDEIAKRHSFTLSRRNKTSSCNNTQDSFMEATHYSDPKTAFMPPEDRHDDDEYFRYLISSESKMTNVKIMDNYSHIVPDDDHDHYDLQYHPSHDHYYYSRLLLADGGVGQDATAPTTSEFGTHLQMQPNFLDGANHADAAAAAVMVNSKTSNNFSVKGLPCCPTYHDNVPITVPAAAEDDDDDDEDDDYKHSVVPHHHHDLQVSPHRCCCESSDPQPKLVVHNSSTNNANTNKAEVEAEAEAEAEAAIVPSLSVCSNDLPNPGSNAQDQDDSAYPTQIHQEHDQQALAKKLGTSRATLARKKYIGTRTSKFHNLSERKRRDNKIKKKMRQLQQLIPNCDDKVDKASILDEAIVYLKALQLQLQMMSMGAGVMPPMMIGNGTLMPHLNYMPTTSAVTPTFPMFGFHHHAASFVPLVTPSLIVPHPSMSLSTSMNSNPSHQPRHDKRQPH